MPLSNLIVSEKKKKKKKKKKKGLFRRVYIYFRECCEVECDAFSFFTCLGDMDAWSDSKTSLAASVSPFSN
jgi:hypothetical protein